MTWKVALVTHGAIVAAWIATWIVYAVKLKRSHKETATAMVETAVQRVRADKLQDELAECKDRIEVGGLDDETLSDAVHDSLRGAVAGDDSDDG